MTAHTHVREYLRVRTPSLSLPLPLPPSFAERQRMACAPASERLPVHAARKSLLEYVRAHRVLIVVGETGSGKTTQIPQYLYREGYAVRFHPQTPV